MNRAIVVGAGIAGLSLARALEGSAKEIIILDGGQAPQGDHLHVLLEQGQRTLDRLFPGSLAQLAEEGAPVIDWALDTKWETMEGEFPRYRSQVRTLSMGRRSLEKVMRAGLGSSVEMKRARFSKVLVREGRVVGILTSEGEELPCDLLVVAGGARFPLKRLFGEFIRFTEEMHEVNLTYRSVLLESSKQNEQKQYYYQIDPPRSSLGGVLSPVANGLYMCTLIQEERSRVSRGGIDEYVALSRKIPRKDFSAFIDGGRIASSVAVFRKKFIHRRRLRSSPAGVIFAGDVLLSLNPVFGQGMALSLMQAELLSRLLKGGGFSEQRFQRLAARMGRLPYLLSLIGSRFPKILRIILTLVRELPPVHHGFLLFLHRYSLRRFA